MCFDYKMNPNLPSQIVLGFAHTMACVWFRMRTTLFKDFYSYAFTKFYERKQCLLKNDQ